MKKIKLQNQSWLKENLLESLELLNIVPIKAKYSEKKDLITMYFEKRSYKLLKVRGF